MSRYSILNLLNPKPVLGLLSLEDSLGLCATNLVPFKRPILLMDKILHYPKDPKLWELWYIPYNG